MKKLLLFFAAGCLGAVANSLGLWLLGHFDITRTMNIAMTPTLNPFWLYPRIVWGASGDSPFCCRFWTPGC